MTRTASQTALAFLFTVSLLQGQELVLDAQDMRSIDAARRHQATIPFQLPLQELYGHEDRQNSEGGILVEFYGPVVPELTQWILGSLPEGAMDGPGAYLNEVDGMIWSRSTRETQAKIAAAAQRVREALLASVEVEIHVLDAGALARSPGGVLEPQEVDALLAAVGAHPVHRDRLRLGNHQRIAVGERRAFVKDFNVEVASKSFISDPIVGVLSTGLEIGLRVDRAPSDRLFARVVGRSCDLEKMAPGPTPSAGLGTLQLPSTRSALFSSVGSVAEGGGLLIGGGSGSAPAWLLRLRSDRPAVGWVLPVAPLTTPLVRRELPKLLGPLETDYQTDDSGDDDFESTPMSIDEFVELLRLAAEEETDVNPENVDGQLWLRADSPQEKRARGLVTDIAARVAAGISIDVRYGLVDAAGLETVAKVVAGTADVATAGLKGAMGGAGRIGDDVILVAGREDGYLRDQDVEIAESAKGSDPIVGALFAGLALRLRAMPDGTDRLVLSGEMSWSDGAPTTDTVSFGLEEVGAIQTPVRAGTRGTVFATLTKGSWTSLCSHSMGEGRNLVLIARLR